MLKKSGVEIDITKKKFARFKDRICQSFRAYEKHRHRDAKAAYRLILKRINFLTSNTRLVNNKGNALVGVFFGNPNLTKYNRLMALDKILANQANKIVSVSLKEKLKSLSFEKGHQEKTYTKFNRHLNGKRKNEFSQIVGAWRHEK